ncbi:MAG: bL9 family ribosomal protein [Enterobacteriaceae bacterium]
MKIILLDKILKLGLVGSKVNAKSGYIRNQLIPKGLSIYNECFVIKNIKSLFNNVKKNKICFIHLYVNCNNKGNLFGSINLKKIFNIIKNYNIKIKKKNINFNKIIRNIGQYVIKINNNNSNIYSYESILLKIFKKK